MLRATGWPLQKPDTQACVWEAGVPATAMTVSDFETSEMLESISPSLLGQAPWEQTLRWRLASKSPVRVGRGPRVGGAKGEETKNGVSGFGNFPQRVCPGLHQGAGLSQSNTCVSLTKGSAGGAPSSHLSISAGASIRSKAPRSHRTPKRTSRLWGSSDSAHGHLLGHGRCWV